jgi:hypothetical protein
MLNTHQHRLVGADCMLQENSQCYLPLATHTIIKAANAIIFCFYGGKMVNAPYKMAASTGHKRMPITTPSYNKVPSDDVTPDPPTFSLDTPLKILLRNLAY